jgi:hypothetical protein
MNSEDKDIRSDTPDTIPPPFLDIGFIVFGTEIKKRILKASYTSYG